MTTSSAGLDRLTPTALTQPYLAEVELSADQLAMLDIIKEYSAFLDLLDRINAQLVGSTTDSPNEDRLPAPIIIFDDEFIPKNSNGIIGFNYGNVVGEIFDDCEIRFWKGNVPAGEDDPELSEALLGCLVEIAGANDEALFDSDMESDGADNRRSYGAHALRAWEMLRQTATPTT